MIPPGNPLAESYVSATETSRPMNATTWSVSPPTSSVFALRATPGQARTPFSIETIPFKPPNAVNRDGIVIYRSGMDPKINRKLLKAPLFERRVLAWATNPCGAERAPPYLPPH